MLALKSVIPEIGELEIGQDILHDDRSWDILLLMKFETIEALRRYQSHSDHQAVMAFNGPYVTDVASLDYEAPFTPTKGI